MRESAGRSPGPIVRISGLTKTFGCEANAVHALRGVVLDCEPNRLTMIAGPSGCGKTTLLSIISGMLRPTAGTVSIWGVDWSRLSENEKTRRRGELIGYVFQQFRLIPTLPIETNVAVPLLARGIAHREALRRAVETIEQVGLGDRVGAFPADLSGGMQQRVALARALVGQPRLLICDEPTANLDRETGEEVMGMIYRASRGADELGRPRAVIVVTHDYRMLRFGDVIYRMEDGRLCPASVEMLVRVWHAAAEPVSPERGN